MTRRPFPSKDVLLAATARALLDWSSAPGTEPRDHLRSGFRHLIDEIAPLMKVEATSLFLFNAQLGLLERVHMTGTLRPPVDKETF